MLRPSLLLSAVAALLCLGACDGSVTVSGPATPTPRAPQTATGGGASDGIRGRITEVVDGDTLHVTTTNGRRERVRLIGIDAPERSTTRTGYAECGGEAATELLERLADQDPQVRLVRDRGQDARDRFGRVLAYVEPASGSGGTFQVELLRAGLARVYVYARDPFERVDEFRAAASEARRAGRGVWASCGGDFRRPAR